jgi:ribosomal protein S18 acetylase RimI-like enzyme
VAVTVEPATPGDADAVADLWVALVESQHPHGTHLRGAPNRAVAREFLAASAADDALYVARDGGLVGFVQVHVADGAFDTDAVRGVVDNLFVVPGRRDEGVGSRLLDAAEDALARKGAGVVSVEAMADNDAARRLYESRGYRSHRVEYERPANDTHTRDPDE